MKNILRSILIFALFGCFLFLLSSCAPEVKVNSELQDIMDEREKNPIGGGKYYPPDTDSCSEDDHIHVDWNYDNNVHYELCYKCYAVISEPEPHTPIAETVHGVTAVGGRLYAEIWYSCECCERGAYKVEYRLIEEAEK